MAKRKDATSCTTWNWAETHTEVTDENIKTAYKLHFKQHKPNTCRKSCRGNPNCLSGWGEGQWTEPIDKEAEMELGRGDRCRTPGSYVGLKNLGNTCYINCLVQLWFHNESFREAVYGWNAAEDPLSAGSVTEQGPYRPLTSVAHLQLLFADMQFGVGKICDPEQFCTSLSIDVELQQDAQEFNKLYLQRLEEAFHNQSNKRTSNMIQSQLRGQLCYVTKCLNCQEESRRQSHFYELELKVKDCNTILDSIADFLNEESLSGDNQYSCSRCSGFQNATMRLELETLPPVLHLQLLRYVFDVERGTKRKIHNSIQFPDLLNMSPFVSCPGGESLKYKLHAVLMHGGGTAYSGHYYAHINTAEGWHVFDDASVKKEKVLNLNSDKVAACKKPTGSKLKGFRSSTAAYMLVYTREEDTAE